MKELEYEISGSMKSNLKQHAHLKEKEHEICSQTSAVPETTISHGWSTALRRPEEEDLHSYEEKNSAL